MSTDACNFYSKVVTPLHLWLRLYRLPMNSCEEVERVIWGVPVNQEQAIFVAGLDRNAPSRKLHQIVFLTDDPTAMRRYLARKGLISSGNPKDSAGPEFGLHDPEGYLIGFTGPGNPNPDAPRAVRLIHAGFIVRDRAATEHFYKDILGFRPYWHGGMKDDQTDWISMQVPDGTDWLEFMVNVEPDADKKLRGIMNHIALGVPDIHAAQQQLLKNGVKLTEEPQIGRDGKWQLNLYDPDDTRIEFMEFTPVQKPCCSEFTGPHPGPQSPSKAPAKP